MHFAWVATSRHSQGVLLLQGPALLCCCPCASGSFLPSWLLSSVENKFPEDKPMPITFLMAHPPSSSPTASCHVYLCGGPHSGIDRGFISLGQPSWLRCLTHCGWLLVYVSPSAPKTPILLTAAWSSHRYPSWSQFHATLAGLHLPS